MKILLRSYSSLISLLLLSPFALLAGCGGSSGGGTGSPAPADTSITVTITSTANARLQQFGLQLQSLSLVSKSGHLVSLFASSPNTGLADFIHLNGFREPLLTVSVPQDTYTSATATIGSAQFTCVTLDSTGGLHTSTYAYGSTPSTQVTINLPQNVVVGPEPMELSLDLQSVPSATFNSCVPIQGSPFSINPTFNLNPIMFASPINSLVSVQQTTLRGIASAPDATGTFVLTTADGLALNVATQPSTILQGLSSLNALVPGTAVEADLNLGENGSVDATRIQLLDNVPTNLSIMSGPLETVYSANSVLQMNGTEQQGALYAGNFVNGSQPISFGAASFQVSGYLDNLAKMPFTPDFSAATMVAGQNIGITTHATSSQGGPTYNPAATITLLPQTIDGMVTAITSSGSGNSTLNSYTVTLAPYDLFPTLAVQAGQTTLLTSPNMVTVYTAGGSIGIQGLTVGNLYRFTGLVFNDHGALKMDCLQTLAGVPE